MGFLKLGLSLKLKFLETTFAYIYIFITKNSYTVEILNGMTTRPDPMEWNRTPIENSNGKEWNIRIIKMNRLTGGTVIDWSNSWTGAERPWTAKMVNLCGDCMHDKDSRQGRVFDDNSGKISLGLQKNECCGYLLEAPFHVASKEYPQQMFFIEK